MNPKTNPKISRRDFLYGSTAALLGLLVPPRMRAGAAGVSPRQVAPAAAAIVADHTIVDQYINIPQPYIDIVKTMWVQALGLSHSGAYRYGVNALDILHQSDAKKFPADGQGWGTVNPPTTERLRVSRYWWHDSAWDQYGVGEEEFWTTQWAIDRIKANITYCNGAGTNPVRAIGFGWCWDMVAGLGGAVDPVYGCHWGGQSLYWNGSSYPNAGRWGLDAGDTALIDPGGTNPNLVNLQTYIDAVLEINAHDPTTLCFFTTGPVDSNTTENEGESGYQRHIKHEYLRNYIQTNGGVLFDFADILCYNDANVLQTTTWAGHPVEPKTFPLIHPDNDGEYASDRHNSGSCHIGAAGCLRLGKALWWMLARVAGWDPGGDTEAPDTPTGLNVTPISFHQIDLTWNASTDNPNPGGSGIAHYRIYRDEVPIGTSATTSYSDTGVAPGRQYAYRVAACDGANNVSALCAPVPATTPSAPFSVYLPLVVK